MNVIVNDGGVVDDGTTIYYPGDLVEFDEDEARRLVKAGAVRIFGFETPEDLHVVVDLDDIVGAIGTLTIDDPALWTASGAPKVEALTPILDKVITSKERDAAWAVYQDRRNER